MPKRKEEEKARQLTKDILLKPITRIIAVGITALGNLRLARDSKTYTSPIKMQE